MSGKTILIEQLRAYVERLELDLAAVAMCDSSDCGLCVSCLVKRAEKAERELQASESCVAFERVTIAELRLEAHQLRTNLHLARLERDEARAERDALPEISDGLVSDAEHVIAWHRSGRIELSPAGRYSRLADYVLRVHAAKVKA